MAVPQRARPWTTRLSSSGFLPQRPAIPCGFRAQTAKNFFLRNALALIELANADIDRFDKGDLAVHIAVDDVFDQPGLGPLGGLGIGDELLVERRRDAGGYGDRFLHLAPPHSLVYIVFNMASAGKISHHRIGDEIKLF